MNIVVRILLLIFESVGIFFYVTFLYFWTVEDEMRWKSLSVAFAALALYNAIHYTLVKIKLDKYEKESKL